MPITLHLSQYEGPLDYLLALVGKAKIDIKDIFVSKITEQYIESIREAEGLDMEEASAFIAMAATLLEIKSRALLPKPKEPEEESPEELLIRQLEEYALFKEAAGRMQAFEAAALKMFAKLPEEFPLPPQNFELKGLSLEGLIEAFARVMERRIKEEPQELVEIRERLMMEQFTLPKSMAGILRRLRKDETLFRALLSEDPCKEEVVTLFLALLELLRQGRALVWQNDAYGDILIRSPENNEE